jgi:hypothetical protein
MTYLEAIKDGFRLVNRNWQLVLIQISMVFISSIGFFIIVGIPLAIAFIIFGIDLTGFADIRDIFGILIGPSDLLSKYLGLFLIVLSAFVYIIAVALLGIYIFEVRSVLSEDRSGGTRDQYPNIFEEAKGCFPSAQVRVGIDVIFIIAAGLGVWAGAAAGVSLHRADSTLALFFGTFFFLLIIIALVRSLDLIDNALWNRFDRLWDTGS